MEKENRQRLIVKICCVFAAFVLWLYISNIENPIITYSLKHVPVQLKNIESLSQYKLILDEQTEYYVDLSIRGLSSDVYDVKKEEFKIIADLSAYSLKNGENRVPIEILSNPEKINIMNNSNLWVRVNLDELIEKTVPVKINLKGEAEEAYFIDEPIVKPTDVIVYGAAKYVNAVNRVEAEVYINKADKDVAISSALLAVDSARRTMSNVKIQPNFVDIVVPIKKTKTVDIKVETEGELDEKYIIKSIIPYPNEILITGYQDVIEGIGFIKTETIDLGKIKDNVIRNIDLVVPEGIKIIDQIVPSLNIQVEKIVQRNLSLNVGIKNLYENYEAELDNEIISLVIEGPQSAIDNIDYKDIKCYVDLMSLLEGTNIVPVNIALPNDISIISQNYEMIKVVITHKEEQDDKVINTDANADTNIDVEVDTDIDVDVDVEN